MNKLLKLEKKLKEAKAELEKAMYKPAAPYRKPTPTTTPKPKESPLSGTEKKPKPIGEKKDISVAHVESNDKEHVFEVRKKGNVVGNAGVRHDRKEHHDVDVDDVGDWDESSEGSNSHTTREIIKEHITKNPETYKQQVKKSIDERLDDILAKTGGRFSGMAGSVAQTGGPSIASQIGFGKKEKEEVAPEGSKNRETYKEEFEDKKDKKKLEKAGGPNKYGEKMAEIRDNQSRQERAPAMDINPKTGEKTLITPEKQVKIQTDRFADRKAKFEAEAKERRNKLRQDGLLKGEDFDLEVVKFDTNGQWSLGE